MAIQKRNRQSPRILGRLRVVALTRRVGECVSRSLINFNRDVLAKFAHRRIEGIDRFERNSAILAAENSQHRHTERIQLFRISHQPAIVNYRRVDIGRHQQRGIQRPATAEAPAERADPHRSGFGGQIAVGLAQVLFDSSAVFHRQTHEFARLHGVLRDFATIEIYRQRHIAVPRHLFGHCPYVVVEPPPFVDQDHSGQVIGRIRGPGQEAAHRSCVHPRVFHAFSDHRRKDHALRTRIGHRGIVPMLAAHAFDIVLVFRLRCHQLHRHRGNK